MTSPSDVIRPPKLPDDYDYRVFEGSLDSLRNRELPIQNRLRAAGKRMLFHPVAPKIEALLIEASIASLEEPAEGLTRFLLRYDCSKVLWFLKNRHQLGSMESIPGLRIANEHMTAVAAIERIEGWLGNVTAEQRPRYLHQLAIWHAVLNSLWTDQSLYFPAWYATWRPNQEDHRQAQEDGIDLIIRTVEEWAASQSS